MHKIYRIAITLTLFLVSFTLFSGEYYFYLEASGYTARIQKRFSKMVSQAASFLEPDSKIIILFYNSRVFDSEVFQPNEINRILDRVNAVLKENTKTPYCDLNAVIDHAVSSKAVQEKRIYIFSSGKMDIDPKRKNDLYNDEEIASMLLGYKVEAETRKKAAEEYFFRFTMRKLATSKIQVHCIHIMKDLSQKIDEVFYRELTRRSGGERVYSYAENDFWDEQISLYRKIFCSEVGDVVKIQPESEGYTHLIKNDPKHNALMVFKEFTLSSDNLSAIDEIRDTKGDKISYQIQKQTREYDLYILPANGEELKITFSNRLSRIGYFWFFQKGTAVKEQPVKKEIEDFEITVNTPVTNTTETKTVVPKDPDKVNPDLVNMGGNFGGVSTEKKELKLQSDKQKLFFDKVGTCKVKLNFSEKPKNPEKISFQIEQVQSGGNVINSLVLKTVGNLVEENNSFSLKLQTTDPREYQVKIRVKSSYYRIQPDSFDVEIGKEILKSQVVFHQVYPEKVIPGDSFELQVRLNPPLSSDLKWKAKILSQGMELINSLASSDKDGILKFEMRVLSSDQEILPVKFQLSASDPQVQLSQDTVSFSMQIIKISGSMEFGKVSENNLSDKKSSTSFPVKIQAQNLKEGKFILSVGKVTLNNNGSDSSFFRLDESEWVISQAETSLKAKIVPVALVEDGMYNIKIIGKLLSNGNIVEENTTELSIWYGQPQVEIHLSQVKNPFAYDQPIPFEITTSSTGKYECMLRASISKLEDEKGNPLKEHYQLAEPQYTVNQKSPGWTAKLVSQQGTHYSKKIRGKLQFIQDGSVKLKNDVLEFEIEVKFPGFFERYGSTITISLLTIGGIVLITIFALKTLKPPMDSSDYLYVASAPEGGNIDAGTQFSLSGQNSVIIGSKSGVQIQLTDPNADILSSYSIPEKCLTVFTGKESGQKMVYIKGIGGYIYTLGDRKRDDNKKHRLRKGVNIHIGRYILIFGSMDSTLIPVEENTLGEENSMDWGTSDIPVPGFATTGADWNVSSETTSGDAYDWDDFGGKPGTLDSTTEPDWGSGASDISEGTNKEFLDNDDDEWS